MVILVAAHAHCCISFFSRFGLCRIRLPCKCLVVCSIWLMSAFVCIASDLMCGVVCGRHCSHSLSLSSLWTTSVCSSTTRTMWQTRLRTTRVVCRTASHSRVSCVKEETLENERGNKQSKQKRTKVFSYRIWRHCGDMRGNTGPRMPGSLMSAMLL